MLRVVIAAVAAAALVATPVAATFTDTAASRGSSAHAADVFASRVVPTITGFNREGETLTASVGDEWLRCDATGAACAAIDAPGSTYRPGAADVGATLRVRTATTTSDAVGPIRRSYASEVMLDRPSMFLRLDGTRTATAGANAAAHGSTGFSTSGALAQNAANQAATFTPASALGVSGAAVGGAGTVELWFKGASGVLVGTQNGTPFTTPSAYAPLIYVDTGGVLRAGMFDTAGAARVISSGKAVTDGVWHHAAVTRSGATLRLYLDGAHAGSVTATSSWSVQTNASVGSGVAESAWWPGTGSTTKHWQHFTGQVDEVATYPSALSQTRLQAHVAAAR